MLSSASIFLFLFSEDRVLQTKEEKIVSIRACVLETYVLVNQNMQLYSCREQVQKQYTLYPVRRWQWDGFTTRLAQPMHSLRTKRNTHQWTNYIVGHLVLLSGE